jgi:RNA polymerase-binding transcription factor DksA
MATPKKPAAKAAAPKKAVAATPSKKPVAAKGTVAKSAPKAETKAAAPAPKKAAAAPSAPAPAKKAAAAPVKAVAPKKVAAPAKSVEAPAPKKAAAPVAKPVEAPKPVAAKKAAAPAAKAEATAAAPPPKPSKADQKAALKRTQSAVQRVQAKVAAAIPKPQPKPAPMPTVLPGRDDKKSNVIVAHRRLEGRQKAADDNSMTMINYQPDFTRSILDKEEKDTTPLYRYSDEELNEFKELIAGRLATARKELSYQQGLITHKDATGTDDTENRYMNMEDGSGAMEREQLAQLASRQIQFINHLEKAMVRIENKTYGICRVTGKLIDKARLRAVPHATLSIEAKNTMNK